MRARARVRRNPGDTLEDRVAALEKNFVELEREHDERSREFETDFGKLNVRVTAMREELDQQHREREEQRREFVRGSVALQGWGTLLFVVGAILSVLGNTVHC